MLEGTPSVVCAEALTGDIYHEADDIWHQPDPMIQAPARHPPVVLVSMATMPWSVTTTIGEDVPCWTIFTGESSWIVQADPTRPRTCLAADTMSP